MSELRLCGCGCGEQTPLAARTDRRHGHIKGQPLQFIKGHRRPIEKSEKRKCAIADCSKPVKARGWCSMHLRRWTLYGDPNVVKFTPIATCTVDRCDGKHVSRGFCSKHESRMRRHGNLTGLQPRTAAAERFEKNVDKSGDCWVWTGHTDKHGYGSIGIGSQTVKAHRFSYELHVGPIAAGMVICHSCDNPPCVNPDHLFAGTQGDNVRDMFAKGRGRLPHEQRSTP